MGIDGLEPVFDDGSLVADAGLLLPATVMHRLGLEALIDDTVRPGGSAGSGPGRKVLSLVASMLVGGCCIDDADRLRSGSGVGVLGFAPAAASTLGTFLRSFTFGHLRQFDRFHELALGRAWSVGAAPQVTEMTVDVDSTVCEVHGKSKGGAAYGHTKVLGYHPLVAVRDDTGEVLHSRMRSGSSQRGHSRFVRETLARVRRLGADAAVTVRADSGFFSYEMLDAIEDHQARYSITVAQDAQVNAAIAAIDEDAWQSIAYTRGGQAQVAEGTITTSARSRSRKPRTLRLIVRRTPPRRRPGRAVAQLAPPRVHHRPRRPRHQRSRRLPPRPRPSRACHQRPQRQRPASLPLRTVLRQRRLARLRRTRPQPPALDSPPRTPPPQRTSHRRRHRAQTAPHSARTPPQPQRPPQTAPAAQLALGHGLHHRPGTHPQPAPAHLSRRSAPGAAQPNPKRHQPHQAPHSSPARPKTRRPAHTHQPSGHPAPNADPTNPSVDSG